MLILISIIIFFIIVAACYISYYMGYEVSTNKWKEKYRLLLDSMRNKKR